MSTSKEMAQVPPIGKQDSGVCSLAEDDSPSKSEASRQVGTVASSDAKISLESGGTDGTSTAETLSPKKSTKSKQWDTMTSVHKAITSEAFMSEKMSRSVRPYGSSAGLWEPHRGKAMCCGLIRRKPKVPPFIQTLVVLRHSERLDHIDPKGYKESDMGKKFPWDGPLTEKGVKLAAEVAEELLTLHGEVGFSAIACSPYLRCLETAREVADRLELPILIDQELAEVWEKGMPSDGMPHRKPEELTELVGEMNLEVANPPLPEGGIRLFGKPPVKHPESLEMGHKRYLVRIESYIRLSAHTRQNFIIVGHAPAVAAVLNIFERGYADIERTEYCARVIARRELTGPIDENEKGVYAAQWDVESKAVAVSKYKPEEHMKKTFENMHIDFCEETNEMVANRKERRTSTDKLFESTIKAIAVIAADEAAEMEQDQSPKSGKKRKQRENTDGTDAASKDKSKEPVSSKEG